MSYYIFIYLQILVLFSIHQLTLCSEYDWIWVGGKNSVNSNPNISTTNPRANFPGGRSWSITWYTVDALWLFGGYGMDADGFVGESVGEIVL